MKNYYPDYTPRLSPRALCTVVMLFAALLPCVLHAEPWPWADPPTATGTSLILLGDFNVQKRADPASALLHVRETLSAADLVYANLEGLLVESRGPADDLPNKTGWTHLGPDSIAALVAGNIGVVGVANNVAYGRENIMRSLTVLDANGILHAGAGRNLEAAHQPAVITRNELRFGFLQYTSKWYDQAQQMATVTEPGVARLLSPDGKTLDSEDRERLLADIRILRPQVDVLIVSTHTRDGQGSDGGMRASRQGNDTRNAAADLSSLLPVNENLQNAEPYQGLLARTAIDAGADIVFGHGCHMLQALEVYRDKPILHCLGNFASDWIRVGNYRYGLLARILISEEGIVRVVVVPVTRDAAENNVMLLDPRAGEGAMLFRKLQDLSPDTRLRIEGREIVLLGE